jgi:predicted metal-dependent hydrolase
MDLQSEPALERREQMIAAIEHEFSALGLDRAKDMAELAVKKVAETIKEVMTWDEEGIADFLLGNLDT